MLSCEATGRNIEQAINNALLELKASRDDVDIKILEEGGFFKKAKVLVSISEDAIEKYEKRDELRNTINQEENLSQENIKQELTTVEQNVEIQQDEISTVEEQEQVEAPAVEVNNPKAENNDLDKAKAFVDGLLKVAGCEADIVSEQNANEVFLNLVRASDLIGFRGEGLNAIQYLTNVYVGKNNRHCKKIRVDCDNYRIKRENTLIALANRMARKVAKTNHAVKLEPMTANERRIIHSALAEDKFVETFSTGEEPYRYLTITPKNKI